MNKLRTIVLEDEENTLNWLVKKLQQFAELDLVGQASTLDESFHLITRTRPDAAFMDIRLIGGDVFMLLKRLQENAIPIPYIVMTTGFPEYVMDALNDHRLFVVQYLVKPFVEDWQKKLRKSVDALLAAKLNETFSIAELESRQSQQSIFINNRGNLLRLDFDKIAYFEAAGGGESYVITDTDTYKIDLTLNKFLELLPSDRFQRISKNNIINLQRILLVNREDRTVEIEHPTKNKSLGVGDTFYTEMMKNLPVAKEPAIKGALPNKPTENKVVHNLENVPAPLLSDTEKNELILEKQKNSFLLRNILPNEVADEFIRTGQTKAQKFDLVTVMFCSIVDTSKHPEHMLPEDLINDIDTCFRYFDEIIAKHDLEKIKTLNYTYICAGGIPKADNNNPLRVLQAAIDIRQFLKEFKVTQQLQQFPGFEARIGLHSGPVIAGVVGHLKFTYDIWGNTVNTASQIERTCSVGHVNLSEDSYQYVKKHFAYRYFGTIEAPDKTEINVYSVEL